MGAGSSTRAVSIAEPEPWRSRGSSDQEKARADAFLAKRNLHYAGMGGHAKSRDDT